MLELQVIVTLGGSVQKGPLEESLGEISADERQ